MGITTEPRSRNGRRVGTGFTGLVECDECSDHGYISAYEDDFAGGWFAILTGCACPKE
jgi:hypothetical protein